MGQIDNDLLAHANDVIATVAYRVHKRYRTYVDVSDVRQECLEWCLKRPDKIEQWLSVDQDKNSLENGIRALAKTLSRHADRFCRKPKAQAAGYELRDEAYYTPELISELLPHVWTSVVETRDPNQPKISGGGNPAEGGNYVISLMDIRRAMDRLTPDDLMILEMIFHQAYTLAEAAHSLGVSESTIHRRKTGALKRMMNFLGGDNPFEYRRRMSNAQAQAVLE